MGNNGTNIRKNIIWNTVGSIFYCACQWLITIVVVHLSSYEAAGYLSIAMTTSSSFSAISLFSMRNYQISDANGEYTDNEYVGSRIFTCAAAFISCVLVCIATNSVYQTLCVSAFMIIRVAEGFVDVLHGVNQKYDRYDFIGGSYILRGIATIASFCIVLKLTGELLITLFVMAFLNLAISLIFDWRKTGSLNRLKPVIISRRVIELLKQCLPIVIYAFLLSLENLIPKMVLQNVAGTDELGIYSSIASPTLVVQVFASVAFNPLLPGFAEVYAAREYDRFAKMLHKVYAALIILAAVVTFGAALVGRFGLKLLFGKYILNYYYLFMPIVWCTICTAVIWVLAAIVTALRKNMWLLFGMAIDFVICLGIVYPCINAFEKNGVSIAQLIVFAIYIIFLIAICEIVVIKARRRENYEKAGNYSGV